MRPSFLVSMCSISPKHFRVRRTVADEPEGMGAKSLQPPAPGPMLDVRLRRCEMTGGVVFDARALQSDLCDTAQPDPAVVTAGLGRRQS